MRPLMAHCHLGLGKLSLRTDKRDQARAHLTTATALYREMDMRFWLEQAEAQMNSSAESLPFYAAPSRRGRAFNVNR
jgi:hypothetical protein